MEILFNELERILSKLSRNVNCHLAGDCSGDSFSRRTARGLTRHLGHSSELKTTSNINPIHLQMAGSYLLLKSKNKNINIVGYISLASLIYFYKTGKKNTYA